MEEKLTWGELTDDEKVMAVFNYAAVRSCEEEKEFDFSVAEELAPYCRGYYRTANGAIEVDI